MSNFDCIVIGAGIAGMTAAIYLKRANVNVLLLEKSSPGGLLNKVKNIENYPGFDAITGPDLAYKVYEQLKKLGIEVQYGNVLDISNNIVKTDISEYSTKFVIIATGRTAKTINENLDNMSYCVLCDANLYKDKIVAIITNDEDEVLYLSDICKKVIVISKSLSFSKSNIIVEKNLKNIIKDGNKATQIVTENKSYDVEGIFISLGYEPSKTFMKEIITESGYIKVDNTMKTNVDYVYACGDIIKKDLYQISTAIGEAALAATNVKKALKDK